MTCEAAVARLQAGVDTTAADAAASLPWRVRGLRGGARAFFVSQVLSHRPRPALIVVPTGKDAEAMVEDLRFFFGEDESAPPFARRIHYFPAWDTAPFEDVSPTAEVVAARIEGLYHLHQTRDPIVVTTPEALLQRVPPRERFATHWRYLVEGDTIDLDAMAAQLDDWGYRRVPLVEDRGDFSVRGGVLDIFPPAHPQPLRIELLGDLIESMREFDPVTQRSLEARPEFLVLPVREFDARRRSSRDTVRAIEARAFDLDISTDERNQIVEGLTNGLLFPGVEVFLPYFHPSLDTVADYLPPQTLVWVDNAGEVDATVERAWADIERRAAARAAEHRFVVPVEQLYLSPGEWRHAFTTRPTIELEPLDVMTADGGTPRRGAPVVPDARPEDQPQRHGQGGVVRAGGRAGARLGRRGVSRRRRGLDRGAGRAARAPVRQPRGHTRARRRRDRGGAGGHAVGASGGGRRTAPAAPGHRPPQRRLPPAARAGGGRHRDRHLRRGAPAAPHPPRRGRPAPQDTQRAQTRRLRRAHRPRHRRATAA